MTKELVEAASFYGDDSDTGAITEWMTTMLDGLGGKRLNLYDRATLTECIRLIKILGKRAEAGEDLRVEMRRVLMRAGLPS